jgi:mannose-1-phosphate guanylyltransferase
VKALVLAAGQGSGLRPLSDSGAVPLLEVAGLPLLQDVLDHLASSGITGVVVNGSRWSGELESAASSICGELGMEFAFQRESVPLGTAGAAAMALPLLGDPFAVVYGNTLSRTCIGALADEHSSGGAGITLSLSPVGSPQEEVAVTTFPDGRVADTRLKPPPEEAVTNLVFSGTLICCSDAFGSVEPGTPAGIMEHVVPRMLEEGLQVRADTPGGYCRRVCTPESFLLCCYDVLRGSVKPWSGPAAGEDGRLIQGAVHPGAEVRGVLWSAEGSVVESGSFLENCVVMEGSVVESGVRMKNSLVLPGTRVVAGTCCDDKYLSVLGRA